jgi:hypothetical protein
MIKAVIRVIVGFLLMAAFIFLVSLPAKAQPACDNHDTIAKSLKKEYGEEVVAMGISKDGKRIFSVYANIRKHTWTILSTSTRKMSCFIASGVEWKYIVKGEES